MGHRLNGCLWTRCSDHRNGLACDSQTSPWPWIFWLLAMVLWVTLPQRAANAGEVTVDAQVAPFISVFPFQNVADIGAVTQTGITANLPFAIESNTARITISVQATHLYLDADPAKNIFLTLNRNAGVDLVLSAATVIDGQDANAAFIATETLNKASGIYEGWKTEMVTLESEQPGNVFQQDLFLSLRWEQEANLMPSGDYRGYVVLFVVNL